MEWAGLYASEVIKNDIGIMGVNIRKQWGQKSNNNIIRITESEIRDIVRESVEQILSKVKCDYHVGKYEVVNGLDEYDITPYLYHSLRRFGWTYQVKMYFSEDDTYCLLRRKDNKKLFFAKIVPAPELGEKQTKFVPCRPKEVPQIIFQDVQRFLSHSSESEHNVT